MILLNLALSYLFSSSASESRETVPNFIQLLEVIMRQAKFPARVRVADNC